MVGMTTLVMTVALAQANDDSLDVPPPEPEELPPKVLPPPDEITPNVTIRREEGRVIEEYRHQGQLYMVKVTPDNGVTYYLLDADGDGHLETRDIEMGPGVQPVYFKLIEW